MCGWLYVTESSQKPIVAIPRVMYLVLMMSEHRSSDLILVCFYQKLLYFTSFLYCFLKYRKTSVPILLLDYMEICLTNHNLEPWFLEPDGLMLDLLCCMLPNLCTSSIKMMLTISIVQLIMKI